MVQVVDIEGLPDAAERKRISERAKQSLAEARALMEQLERLDAQAPPVPAEAGLVEHLAVPLIQQSERLY
jgi:hypothetical protein